MARAGKKSAKTKATSAFDLGIVRTVQGTLKRFAALATICALGVTMICGLKVACIDLRASADAFFDEQDLFDLRVVSTLGLTDDDVDALADLGGVEAAEGGWVETCYTAVGSTSEKVDVKALSSSGMNRPYVLEGQLPVTDTQVAVTRRYLNESGHKIGDVVTFHGSDDDSEDAATVFARGEYTICGVVLDPTDINAGSGSMSFRASGGSQYAFFVLPSAVESEAYTAVYLRAVDTEEPLCYSGDYEGAVDAVKARVEAIKAEREEAREQGILDDANAQIDESEADALEQLADGQSQLDDAQAQLDEGAAELADGQAQLDDGRKQIADGQAQLDAGQAELDAQSASAASQLAAAQAQIDSGKAELEANEAQVTDGLQQLADGLGCSVDNIAATLDANEATLDASEKQLVAGRAQAESAAAMAAQLMGDAWPADAWSRLQNATTAADAQAAAAEVNAAITPFVDKTASAIDGIIGIVDSDDFRSLGTGYEGLPEDVRARIDELIAAAPEDTQASIRAILSASANADQIIAQLNQIKSMLSQFGNLADGMAQVVAGEEQVAQGRAQLQEARDGYNQLVDAQAQLAAGRAQLESGQAELDAQRKSAQDQLDAAQKEIDDGQAQLDASAKELEEGAAELADGAVELAEGQAQLDEARAEYEEQRAHALDLIAEARAKLSDLDDATWYIQDRNDLSSYASVESDASSIEAIGTVIPIVFFVVAILISLTTMTRMVEEERGLIGLYKALGYSRGRILSKYVLYAAAACLVGGIVGNLLGFVILPLILFTIFETMYALPAFFLQFDAAYAFGSVALFAVGIVGATALTCRRELVESPASLMRPKAPKAGSRILLERIRPLWRSLGFLNKVTARNLLRYKKRFFMTVFGIAGCTALLVCGFGIRDTVLSLPDRQYGEEGVNRYDLMAVTSASDLESLAQDLNKDSQVKTFMPLYIDSITVSFGDASESMQLYVVPEGVELSDYVNLADGNGAALDLAELGSVATVNAQQVLGFAAGDSVHVQDSSLAEADVSVAAVAQSYLGNSLFMTAEAFEEAFGEDAGLNGLLVGLSGTDDEKIAFSEELSADSRTLSVSSTAKLVRDFSSAFTLINTVVYVVIILAAALSFTVVFTLSNTNISERERELATIKVLGFKRPEVHRYINKETLILTGLGVLAGLPAGYALTRSLTYILKMPSLYFDTIVAWPTYIYAVVLAFAFTLMVNAMTNRALDRVDMVGALKSAE